MAANFKIVSSKPADSDGSVGDLVKVIADGLFWGRFKKCRNWIGQEFWLACDEFGRLF